MKNNLAKFVPENYYHVFNRTNNEETLFLSESNRFYFMNLIKRKLEGFAKVLAFSFLDTHFHYCIYVDPKLRILKNVKMFRKSEISPSILDFLSDPEDDNFFHELISKRFEGVFISYAQSFNIEYKRKGNLFYKSYKRTLIDSKENIKSVIYYIHHNARKHDMVQNFKDHDWNSYHLIVNNEKTYLDFDLLFEVYNDMQELIDHHSQFLLEKDAGL